jgi:hypothetical protein
LIQILSRVDSIVADSYFTEPLRRLLQPNRTSYAQSEVYRLGLHREVGRLLALKKAVYVAGGAPVLVDVVRSVEPSLPLVA